MKIENEIITNHLQEILDEKQIPLKYFVKQAVIYGLSRATVYKVAAHRHCKMSEEVSHGLVELLNVSHDTLITWSPNMDTYFDDDLRGFTPKNLEILSKEMAEAGVDLHYCIWRS